MDPIYKDLSIVIPSLSRSKNVQTIRQFSDRAKRVTTILVHPHQLNSYRKNIKDVKVLWTDTQNHGLYKVREYAIKSCKTRYVILMDDDLRFDYRIKSGDWHAKVMDSRETFNRMIREFMTFMKDGKFAHGSISMREGNNRVLEDWEFNQRYARFLFYDIKQLKDVGLARVDLMDDFDRALQLLRLGKKSAIFYMYCQGHGNSNDPGGCSKYRTMSVQTEIANKLASLHPEFVKTVRKKTKTAWNGQERTDVMIYWKKAYESSR